MANAMLPWRRFEEFTYNPYMQMLKKGGNSINAKHKPLSNRMKYFYLPSLACVWTDEHLRARVNKTDR